MLLAFRWLLPLAAAVSTHPALAQQPWIDISGASAKEGDVVEFTVTLSRAVDHEVRTDWSTDEFSAELGAYPLATKGADFIYGSGTLTFEPGETKKTISVQTKADMVSGEADEAVVVTLENLEGSFFALRGGSDLCPWGSCSTGVCCACGLILDDAYVPGMRVSDATANESAGGIEFRVSLDKSSEDAVSATLTTADGTAAAGEDYTKTTKIVEFSAGETSQTVTVPIIDDDDSEGEETMFVRLSNRNGAYFLDGQGRGTIIDDDVPRMTLSSSAADEGSAVQFTLSLSDPAPPTGVSVSCATANRAVRQRGPPAYPLAASNDFVSFSKPVRIAGGESSTTVQIHAQWDNREEPDEAILFRCENPRNATFATFSASPECPWRSCGADGTCGECGLIRDKPPEHTLTVSDASGSESVGRMEFTLTLDKKLPRAFGLWVETRNGTAVVGEDLQRTAYGFVWFPDDPLTTTIAAFITDDDEVEPDETFEFRVTTGDAVRIVNGSATGTILDDDGAPETIALAASPKRVSEGGGATEIAVTATFDRGRRTEATEVSVSVSGGGDPGAVDFAAVEDFAITIPSGESSGTGTFTLTPEDDNVDETDETVSVDGSSDLDVTGDTIELEDDDEGPSGIVLSAEPRTVSEGAGETSVEVTATLDGGARTTATEVTVSVAGGGDPDAVDFDPVPDFAIVIAAGASAGRATFALTPEDDGVDERDEVLDISGTSDLPVTATAVTLADDDAASTGIELSATPSTVSEGAGETIVEVTARLDGGARTTDTEVAVSVSGSGDPDAVEFAAVPDFAIVIAAGSSAGRATFALRPVDDDVVEADETLSLSGEAALPVAGAEVTITDDDAASREILLSATPSLVSEGDGAVSVRVTASLSGAVRQVGTTVTVSVSSSGDPGAVDFAAVPDFTITIDANAASGSGTFTLAPEDDGAAETDETLTVSGDSDLPVASTTVRLADDDASTRILLSASPGRVSEGDGPTAVKVTATLDGGGGRESTTVTVSVSGSGDPDAVDFAAVPDFAIVVATNASSGSGTFILAPEDDAEAESDERLAIAGRSDLPVTPTSVTLADDDEESTRILLSLAVDPPRGSGGRGAAARRFDRNTVDPPRASEGDGEIRVTVTAALDGGARRSDTRIAASVSGSGDPGAVDFAPVPGFGIVIAAGEPSGTATFALVPEDDLVVEADETLTVSGVSDLPVAPATMELLDDDEAPVRSLSIADAGAAEGAGEMEFAVTLDGPAASGVTVDYATADPAGSMGPVAEAGVDYEPAAGTLEFAPGEVSKTIRVAILDDALDEPDEEFAVVLSGPRGASLDRGSAAGTIRDDDETPSLSVADASGGEDVGELEFAVALSAPSGIGVSASYATSDGTAEAGVDYEPAAGTLEFAPGEVSKTIRVAVIDDDLHEADEETFGLSLSALANASAADVSATGTIRDDDLAPPALSGRLPAALLCVGGAPRELDLAEYFAGEELRFSAVSAAPEVASATLDGSRLSIVPGIEGETSVAVSAANGSGTAGGAVEVRVAADPAELEALESALASIGRGILAGVSGSVRARFDPAALPGERGASSGAPRAAPPAVRDAGGLRIPPMPSVGLPGRDRGGLFGAEAGLGGRLHGADRLHAAGRSGRGMEPFSFSLDSAGADGPAWSVWGRGEAQRFGSAPGSNWHDGALESAHVGAEWRTGDWLAGVSASRSAAEADYRFERSVEACGGGSGSGEIEADVSGVHPYLGRRVGAGWVWATLGRGGGEFRMRRCEGGEWSASDLSMRLAAAGGRHPFARRESTELSVVEEVGVVELEAGGAAGLLARAGRAKLGLEASGVAEAGCDCPLTTFVRAFALGDWGDGATGAGLEVSAGVRFRHIPRRFGVDAGVRALAFHSAEDARERSANVALSLLPRADGTGWRGSLAWRRGSAAPVLGVAGGIAPWAAPGGVPQAARRGWASRSRLGYGIAGARGVATPFVELDAARSGSGARVGARHEFGGPAGRLVVEWGVERGGLPGGGGRVLLEAVGRF